MPRWASWPPRWAARVSAPNAAEPQSANDKLALHKEDFPANPLLKRFDSRNIPPIYRRGLLLIAIWTHRRPQTTVEKPPGVALAISSSSIGSHHVASLRAIGLLMGGAHRREGSSSARLARLGAVLTIAVSLSSPSAARAATQVNPIQLHCRFVILARACRPRD